MAEETITDLPKTAEPPNKLLEYLRAGKFSPAVAAQLARALNAEDIFLPPAGPDTPAVAPPAEYDVIQAAGDVVTIIVLGVLFFGAVAISLSLTGLIDESPLIWVAGLLLFIVLLMVVVVGSLNQGPLPIGPRPASAAQLEKAGKAKPGGKGKAKAKTKTAK